jgi:rhodanese-related sulfurtransferase
MKRILYVLPLLLLSCELKSQLPFKYDNNLYQAVFLNEAFRLMSTTKHFLLLDVRSPGEYADTSRSTALNIGRFKGAVNIAIDSVPGRMNELIKYKNEPVFVYCSHSQRSRRVSKLLSENGFKKIYNINGGMSQVNEMDGKDFPFKDKVHVTHTNYVNVGAADAVRLIQNNPGIAIIDIRTEAEFNSRDSLQQNNIGHLKNAINIPQADFPAKIDQYHISNKRPVLLYDLYGDNSMDVVDILRGKGFTRIYNLYGGLSSLICDHRVSNVERSRLLANSPAYAMLDPKAAIDIIRHRKNLVIIDTRPADEFDNKSSISWHNLGRLDGAVNISDEEALKNFFKQHSKTSEILVCPGMGDEFGPRACQWLANNGFRKVNFLKQGMYRFVWATANIEDCKDGRSLLVNHEGLY